MSYFRQEIPLVGWDDFLPDGGKIYMRPDLPKIEVKRGKTKYTITDLRLLHPIGVETLKQIVTIVANEPTDEVRFLIPIEQDDETIDIVADIVTGFSVDAKRRGGKYSGGRIVSGTTVEHCENGGRTITFHVVKEFAEDVYEAAQNNNSKSLDFYGLVMDYTDKQFDEMMEWIRENAQ